jgi:hypothetical protein
MGRRPCRASGREVPFPNPQRPIRDGSNTGVATGRISGIGVADEDFTSVEAALQVVEKFASRLTAGDAEGHVRRSVDELCAAVAKKEGIQLAVDRLLRGLRSLDDARTAGGRRDFQTESPAVDRLLEAVQEELLPTLRRVGYKV